MLMGPWHLHVSNLEFNTNFNVWTVGQSGQKPEKEILDGWLYLVWTERVDLLDVKAPEPSAIVR